MTKAVKTSHNYSPIPPQARLSQSQDSEPTSPSRSSGHRSPESLESSSSHSESPVPPSPCKSPTGSHAKNVKIRLRDNNSYELITTNGSLLENQPFGSKPELEDNIQSEDCEKDKEDEPSLEKFQKRQKMMEEQNKRRRELLVQAIADRSRRTQSEAQKLKQIQSELAKLDSLLSTDVSILRDQIEVASLEFNEAQKRYDKAEKEFIEAKLQLFSKLDKKELLTEHLCRIIEANERRKACKLSQLMAKLEVADVPSEVADTGAEEILPQLASLDEVTYAACTTIKDPKKTTLALQMGLAKINGDIPVQIVKDILEDEKEKPSVNNEENTQESSDSSKKVSQIDGTKETEDSTTVKSESVRRGEEGNVELEKITSGYAETCRASVDNPDKEGDLENDPKMKENRNKDEEEETSKECGH
ncbi:RAB6-interacting golgin-like isoform X2 [Homarus americanus]|nr:RAB6-interacting golgin-like isoform X2 [Homarus americanus]